MLNGEKIGIGIITCNRKESFIKLFSSICKCEYIDCISIVKNLDYDYGEYDPSKLSSDNKILEIKYNHIKERLGIAHNKNVAIDALIEYGCDHIFIIEDDILMKNTDVFKKYIETAKEFNLEHLNFGRSFDTMVQHTWLKPFATIVGKNHKLDLFNRLSGDFSYFTKNALLKAGKYNEKYINALDHCEHTFRMSLLGFYTPFFAFADIENSTDYIEDTGTTTTIEQSEEQKQNVSNAYALFAKTYGYQLNEVVPPNRDKLVRFLKMKQV